MGSTMTIKDILAHPESVDFRVDCLGESRIENPVKGAHFIREGSRILYRHELDAVQESLREGKPVPSFEKAGPHAKIFHNPSWTRAAIATCGGLCPGLNDVIKGLVQALWFDYGVRQIYGVRYGLEGLTPHGERPIMLNPDVVDDIHDQGGTILGSSRGGQDTGTIVDTLANMGINMLFMLGGDGTLRAARDVAEEIKRRGLAISVVGVPKTIDNDLAFIGRSFGFETAVYEAGATIACAHMEAKGTPHGIGLVKLMGRDSGFIAAYAALANSVANFCLIPEVPFTLTGEHGLLTALERRFSIGKDHAVIIVAEGAGQDLLDGVEMRDASGNVLKKDIGVFLRDTIAEHFRKAGLSSSVKYIDPSYIVRSVPARGTDAIHCHLLARNAVHAAMAGRTNCVVGKCADIYMLVPIALATVERQKVDPNGPLWQAVVDATRQNEYMGYEPLVRA